MTIVGSLATATALGITRKIAGLVDGAHRSVNRKACDQLAIARRREHSRKPDEVYRRIEMFCDGPYVELFARQQ
jgi:N6-adenosine-specific RNA methylase IME4